MTPSLPSMLQPALELARAGFAVFPCAPQKKSPLIHGGFKSATRDESQIAAWWTRNPDANIGIATGAMSDVLVIDLDNELGRAILKRVEAKYGALPPTASATTGKGAHLYFRLPTNCGRIPPSQGDGIDVRADGSYVVAPPSIHPNGSAYRWTEGAQTIALAPDWLVEFAQGRERVLLLLGPDLAQRLRALRGKPDAAAMEGMVAALNSGPLAGKAAIAPSPMPLPAASTPGRSSLTSDLLNTQAPTSFSEAEARRLISALAFLPSHNRAEWLQVGMVLHDLDAADSRWNGRTVWDRWSQGSDKFDAVIQERNWQSFGRPRDGAKVTMGTLYYLAERAGWKFENAPAQPLADKADSVFAIEEEATIQKLAALSPVEYDRRRTTVAEQMGIRVATLDKEVEKKRPPDDDSAAIAGRPLVLPSPEPWHMPVEGADLLSALVAVVNRYVVLPLEGAIAVSLWILHTHAFSCTSTSPRLAITSPEKRCGKTTLLRVIQKLVPKALPAANITAAAMFRTIEAVLPTLLIDEADTFLKDNEELRGVLNSGHGKEIGISVRLVGDKHEPRAFATFAPVAIAAIGELPGTIADRSIIISMRRRHKGETVGRLRMDRAGDLETLGRMAARWVQDHVAALSEADPILPEELNDRAADNWRPLVAIADRAGSDWPQRARVAALALSAGAENENETVRTMLLSDLLAIFEGLTVKVPKLTSDVIVGQLNGLTDRPWPTFCHGRPLTPARLASMLKPFGIRPKTIRFEGDRTAKGYMREDFDDAFRRYLPASASQKA